MERSETIGQIAAALSKAQATFKAVPKGKTARIKTKSGAEYSYKYADLADVWDTCRAALAENKLSVIQLPEDAGDGRIGVTTMLCHESGEWVSGFLGMRIADASRTGEMSPQALGMAVTYLRRYGFAAIIGLVTDEDTDAQHGGEQKDQPRQQAKPAQNGEQLTAIISRIQELVSEGAGLKIKLPAAPKALNQMSYDELIAHGKALGESVETAKAQDAEQRFYARYADVVGGQEWASVQKYLGTRTPRPHTFDQWVAAAQAVRDTITKSQAAPKEEAPA